MDATDKHARAKAAMALHGSQRKAARSLGIGQSTLHGWLARAAVASAIPGKLHTDKREVRSLPAKGCRTYILTSAQNNTGLHEAAWQNLQALAAHDGAEILVGGFNYAVNSMASVGEKKTIRKGGNHFNEWDERLTPYLCNRSIELAPGLVWCGELQILPTANDPIAAMESYTGRASSIIPHVKFAVKSIPGPKNSGTKLVYTTGTITLRNYIQKKAGQKASFHHGYGAAIVEVCSDGTWFVRQLNADSEGVIYDLDRRVSAGQVTVGNRPEALVWGDIHTRQLEPHMRGIGWGRGGILDTLRPKRQVLHDILDFRSQNHHDTKDAWKTYAKHVEAKLNVEDELNEVSNFLITATRSWCETIIAAANHDEALIRWLKEADYKTDPDNAEFILEATFKAYRSMRERRDFYAVEWAVERCLPEPNSHNATWLRRDEEYVVCEDAGGGIEIGMHGDVGANGSKGNLNIYARSGRKCIVGHSHAAGLFEGAMQVGVMGALDQGYNVGMSSWSHSNALIYENGKRTLFTIYSGRWHGRMNIFNNGAAE